MDPVKECVQHAVECATSGQLLEFVKAFSPYAYAFTAAVLEAGAGYLTVRAPERRQRLLALVAGFGFRTMTEALAAHEQSPALTLAAQTDIIGFVIGLVAGVGHRRS